MYSASPRHNIVRNWNHAQGYGDAPDGAYQIRRDINLRYITVENSGTRPIGFAITNYEPSSGLTPPIRKILAPGETEHLGINSHGSFAQYLWIIDPQTRKVVGSVDCLRNNSNQFVLRDGLNKWYIHFYKMASYSAAF